MEVKQKVIDIIHDVEGYCTFYKVLIIAKTEERCDYIENGLKEKFSNPRSTTVDALLQNYDPSNMEKPRVVTPIWMLHHIH